MLVMPKPKLNHRISMTPEIVIVMIRVNNRNDRHQVWKSFDCLKSNVSKIVTKVDTYPGMFACFAGALKGCVNSKIFIAEANICVPSHEEKSTSLAFRAFFHTKRNCMALREMPIENTWFDGVVCQILWQSVHGCRNKSKILKSDGVRRIAECVWNTVRRIVTKVLGE